MDSYDLGLTFRLSQATLAIWTSFSWLKVSIAPGRTLNSWSKTAILFMLSTLIGYSWSRRTLAPGAFLVSRIVLIFCISSSFLPIILRRLAFRPSLVTATHRQRGWSFDCRISCSTVLRIIVGVTSPRWSSGTLDVSTVQNTGSGVADRATDED